MYFELKNRKIENFVNSDNKKEYLVFESMCTIGFLLSHLPVIIN